LTAEPTAKSDIFIREIFMKNLLRFVLTVFALIFVFGLTETARAQDQAVINQLYKKMQANLNSLNTLKTGVRLEKYNAQLKDFEERREGEALVIPIKKTRDANFRLEWTKGAQEILSVIDGKYKLYQPKLNQYIEGKSKDVRKSGGAENAFKLITMSSADLKANFNADWQGAEIVANIHSAYKVTLRPKTAASYDHADVWVNEDGMVVQFRVYEKNGDYTNVLLFDIQKNAKISKEQLAVKIPPGTKRAQG
jgi:outer membrane lipoprotein-sorting protein